MQLSLSDVDFGIFETVCILLKNLAPPESVDENVHIHGVTHEIFDNLGNLKCYYY